MRTKEFILIFVVKKKIKKISVCHLLNSVIQFNKFHFLF